MKDTNNHPCESCKTRKFFAKRFDMHFYGEDCWYKCERYEKWKTEQEGSADDETSNDRSPGDDNRY